GVSAHAGRHEIEVQVVTRSPGDIVIGTGRVTAHADSADEPPAGSVECQSSPKHIYPADAPTDHGVVRLTVDGRIAAIGHVGVHGVAFLQSEQTTTRLYGSVEIGSREREPRQAERVGRVSLLGGNDAAA